MIKEIFTLLPAKARQRSGWVALAVLVRAVLDFAGVAALIPLLLAVLKPGGSRSEMLLLCLGVMGFVVVKNGLVVLLARVESRFQLEVYRDFSRRMFVNYYHRGLLFLRSKSSVQLGHEVNYVCYTFCLSVAFEEQRAAGTRGKLRVLHFLPLRTGPAFPHSGRRGAHSLYDDRSRGVGTDGRLAALRRFRASLFII